MATCRSSSRTIWCSPLPICDEHLQGKGGTCPAEWVNTLVYAQFGLFSSFGIVSLYVQCVNKQVRRHFIFGEIVYTIMSITAKALLGGALLVNVLALTGSIGSNVLEQNNDRSVELIGLYNASCPAN